MTSNESLQIVIQLIIHYENLPMQYTEIFSAVKTENFTRKKLDISYIFAQNLHCGYTLEPPHRGGLTSTHNVCFGSKIRKLGIPLETPVVPYKIGVQGLYITRTCFLDEKLLFNWYKLRYNYGGLFTDSMS